MTTGENLPSTLTRENLRDMGFTDWKIIKAFQTRSGRKYFEDEEKPNHLVSDHVVPGGIDRIHQKQIEKIMTPPEPDHRRRDVLVVVGGITTVVAACSAKVLMSPPSTEQLMVGGILATATLLGTIKTYLYIIRTSEREWNLKHPNSSSGQ